ncbi:tyrosine-type recombinase/integrase [Leeuwenhoekiella nanhaiensis]|uniref:Tyr recombinase domain-containing protein n=1 Tax=Leeuwenhoekiella nanhaiensis TaxID=1655491 RepID=A0A2G1VLU7_9FLAO|nr:tyrosine-type recombinase/integrase [Leeuwenhoekiella nanhaiensis]PHQ27694.1 hypothetical protein CJ305_18685 [Leeuwenhoekiella nanhaiensis]
MTKRQRLLLLNGCSVSTPSVNPKNYKEGGVELLQKDWYIQYRFRDPKHSVAYPKGKLCIIKGMNKYQTLKDRRDYTAILLEAELQELKNGWNPITKVHMINEEIEAGKLLPQTPFIDAFFMALEKLDITEKHRKQVNWLIIRLEKAAVKLKYRQLSIDDLTRRQLKEVFELCKMPANYYNHSKRYISSLFTELIEYECCDVNLARDMRYQKVIKKQREVLLPEDLDCVMAYLKINYYEFWRYCKIFMLSGARTSELMRLKYGQVDLQAQEFTVVISKGKSKKEVKKVILLGAIELWKELLDIAKPGEYIFSKGLVPGTKKINDDQVSKRWYRLVKNSDQIKGPEGDPLNITADFYSLKHTFLDSLQTDQAQKLASHTSARTTAIYQVNKEKRDREELKKLRIVV